MDNSLCFGHSKWKQEVTANQNTIIHQCKTFDYIVIKSIMSLTGPLQMRYNDDVCSLDYNKKWINTLWRVSTSDTS